MAEDPEGGARDLGDGAWADAFASRAAEARRRPARITPLWLSHHYPEDYDRCVVIGRTHVCRRCLALYPLLLVVLVAAYAADLPRGLALGALAVLSLPAATEFVLEHLGVIAYSPRRQVGVTLLLAVGLGAGLSAYLHDQLDPVFWAIVLVAAGACLAAVLSGRRRRADDGSASDRGDHRHGTAR